jgi:DNA-binding IclR family transcriptional regulator
VAAPIRDFSGSVCAGVGVTFPAVALPKSEVSQVAKAVTDAAKEISRELGWLGVSSKPKTVNSKKQ